MYGDIIQDLREGLAVSAEHDDSILRSIKQAARQLLKTYNFPKSVVRAPLSIAAATDNVTLPADCGKIKAVQLTTVEGSVKLAKPLLRREVGQLPTYAGPNFFTQVGLKLVIDQPLPAVIATPYYLEVWYQTDSADVAEDWLSVDYQDAIEHLAGMKLGLKKRKTEAAQLYGSLWQQDTKILAAFANELEFSQMDMGFGDSRDTPSIERYPA